jgi:mono/diheme cytochrome c family protein
VSGQGRAADAGLAPAARGDAGVADAGVAPPAEGPAAEPDAEAPPVTPPPPPPPAQDDVSFADVFPVLVANCGNCHGANAPGNRPRFAQAGNQAASFTATQGMSGGGVVSARIIARAVTTRDMPPACGGNALGTGACLDVAEAALLQAWVTQGAQQ